MFTMGFLTQSRVTSTPTKGRTGKRERWPLFGNRETEKQGHADESYRANTRLRLKIEKNTKKSRGGGGFGGKRNEQISFQPCGEFGDENSLLLEIVPFGRS